MEKVSYLGHTIGRWQVGQSTFLALPERGARLMNWSLSLGDGSVRDVIHWPELTSLDEISKVRGGNPILFPFNGRSYDEGEIGFWRAADGVRRPMPMHGLARQGTFRLALANERGFTAIFIPNEEARMAYPYDYEFSVGYRFSSLGLKCELKLVNLGRVPLPWSAGHHFYFTLPWTPGLTRADYLIRVPATRRLRADAVGALVPGPVLQPEESLANPALIDTFHAGLRSNEVVFGEKGRPGDIVMRLGEGAVPPADAIFVTWTMAADSPFYCVEPWMGPPNAAGHKTGLHWVPPGGQESFHVEIAVR